VNDNRYRALSYSTLEQEKSINITVSNAFLFLWR
jgi:hypothetical protein